MVYIPPQIRIRATIGAGSVYYFIEESTKTDKPHFFIIINKKPIDDIILLVCISSQVEKIKKNRSNISPDTLVELNKNDYQELTLFSIVDCNIIFKKTIDQIIELLKRNKLKIKPNIDIKIVQKLRDAVYLSPLIEPELKYFIL